MDFEEKKEKKKVRKELPLEERVELLEQDIKDIYNELIVYKLRHNDCIRALSEMIALFTELTETNSKNWKKGKESKSAEDSEKESGDHTHK